MGIECEHEREIAELKVHNEHLSDTLNKILFIEEEGYRFSSDDALSEIFNICREIKTPEQCLNDIKADAILYASEYLWDDNKINKITKNELDRLAKKLRTKT